jgi:hypothetical protein
MSITQQHTQEQLSRAYVIAVAGVAGINLANVREHDYGVDGTFRSVSVRGSKRHESGYAVDFQLKSTIGWEENPTSIIYDCEADTYNNLAIQDGSEGATPCILLVLCLPNALTDWLHIQSECLTLRRSCYWYRITGPETPNTSSRRIHIPKTQLFTSTCLVEIMERVRLGQIL